ncbi:shikimate dehydrogenase [Mesorhizobium sp. CAU 1732]|uniref:shikimate dehydrogenase family protein n=1 Tax=Mesorhizobium sp. CAU 1732 TaxID=3140358 RepID=UPI003260C93F
MAMRITGKTRIMFILADSVDHIVGSDVLNQTFERMGLDVAVSPLSIAPDDLETALATIRRLQNVVGFGVTIPHKIAALSLMDDVTDAAGRVGAVNFVKREADGRLVGHNIDGEGFLQGLVQNGVDVTGARVLQIGAGGVGKAIAFALAQSGVRSIDLVNRDAARATALCDAISRAAPDVTVRVRSNAEDVDGGAFDIVVNATSLGMHGTDPLPVPLRFLVPSATVAEVIMSPAVTPLLREAEDRGCRVVAGAAMMRPQPLLVAQFLGLSG